MTERVQRKDYPWWVKLSTHWVPGRGGLLFYTAFSLILAASCIVYGFFKPDERFFAGSLFVFSALMYWFSMRWIDEHGTWNEKPNELS